MGNSPVVETQALTKRYGEFTALDSLTISVAAGQILGFIGPNGAGKTTTIRILVGLLRPTSGWARVCGADCATESRRIKHLVGYMPDRFGSYDNMRVSEYLDFFGAAYSIGRRQRVRRIEEVLEITHATYMRDRYVETLSRGMQQRVAIARTLLHDPQVIILDEPASGLDPQARIEMRELLLRLAAMGKTLMVTSHILPELSQICDTVAIITGGKLRAFGSLDQIMREIRQLRTFEVQLTDGSRFDAASRLVANWLKVPLEKLSGSAMESVVRFETQRSDSELAPLLVELIRAALPVGQFREVPTSLEDAFLSVTRNTQSADQKDAGTAEPQGGRAV